MIAIALKKCACYDFKRKQPENQAFEKEPPVMCAMHDWWSPLYSNGQLLSSVHMREKQLLVFRNGDLIPAAAEHAGDLCREQLLPAKVTRVFRGCRYEITITKNQKLLLPHVDRRKQLTVTV